jgi:LacI family transcriptional regulator
MVPVDEGRATVTLEDVARRAGVSASTVSRVLTAPGRISAPTEERVLQAVAELGYRRRQPGGPTGAPRRSSARSAERRRKPIRSAATIYDVARVAGVNASTVSRALSLPGRISPATEQRVHAAAEQLNYRLNPMARALPTGRTFTLGVLVADFTNPVFFNIVRGAEREAAEQGYTLVLAESQESSRREAETAERIMGSIDGLILATTRLDDTSITALAERTSLVVINRRLSGVTSVVPDLSPGLDEALAHLAAQGHRRVAYVAGPRESWMNSARWRVMQRRAEVRGLSVTPIESGVPTMEGGKLAFSKVVATGATGVLAYNDLMAIGLLTAARESGLSVPGGLSIIGFDDIFGADFTSPPLTTIRTPLADLGARAVRSLLQTIGDAPSDVADPLTPMVTELVVRGTTGPPSP